MTNKSLGQWKLPQPTDIKEENDWSPVPRIARTIPFGYISDDGDPYILQPVPLELDLLEKARGYLKQYSLREVSAWLSTNSGRYISHLGLQKRVKHEKQRKDKARSLRLWASYAEKAINTAEKLEARRIGAKKDGGNEGVPSSS
jgi:hypothetical protein|tara:strand:+ start:2056 stop:2487 length:432 start_codon:yes stop_codon:yes gene_type:complete